MGFGLGCAPFARRYSGHPIWFLFLPLLRCFRSGGSRSRKGAPRVISPWQEVPFGDPRIDGYMRLPGAFRSLSRPSSAPEPSHPPGGLACRGTESPALVCPKPSPFPPAPRAIGSGRLNASAEASALTPPPHQRGLLPQPSSTTGARHQVPCRGVAASSREGLRA